MGESISEELVVDTRILFGGERLDLDEEVDCITLITLGCLVSNCDEEELLCYR